MTAPFDAQPDGAPVTALTAAPRVLIVDEDRRVQQSLGDCLRLTGRVNVIGAAGDVRSALEAVERDAPDVVLIDPRLPDVDAGAALIASLTRARPDLRIIVSGWSAECEQPELLTAACSYVTKTGTPEQFIAAVVDSCGAPARPA
jgi:DNA-binding NarL/FixJ family response regulator